MLTNIPRKPFANLLLANVAGALDQVMKAAGNRALRIMDRPEVFQSEIRRTGISGHGVRKSSGIAIGRSRY